MRKLNVADTLERLAVKHGHTLETVRQLPGSEGPVFCSHSQFFDLHPRFGIDAEPCSGTLRVEAKFAGKLALRCDECRFEVSVDQGDWQPSTGDVPDGSSEDPVERLLRVADLPAQFLSRPFEATPDNRVALSAIKAWLADGATLPAPVLYGPPGTGKTHLAVRTGFQLVQSGRRCVFLPASAWLSDMQAGFGSGEHDRLWRRAISAPVLILDDLGAEMATEWRSDRVGALVDERSRRELPLMVTTNISPGAWSDVFNDRTASRLGGMTFPVELQGVDWRTRGRAA